MKIISLFKVIFILFLITIVFPGCTKTVESSDRIKIVASFYPLAEFARQVGGEKVEVLTIVPAGVEPHDFEPTPKDIAQISHARLLILNGAGMESWAEKVKKTVNDKVMILSISDKVVLLANNNEKGQGLYDPHIWLSPEKAIQMANIIRGQLSEIDPQNTAYFNNNFDIYAEKLKKLDWDYQLQLTNCGHRKFITTHNAFAYLANRYNLQQISISGISPDEEPSLKKLAELTNFKAENKIKYVLTETLVSPKLAQTLAGENGGKTLVINPLEGLTPEELGGGEDYLSIMRKNLENFRIALECK